MVCAAALLGVPGAMCFGQSETRAIFVSNNGNLEGSITSMRVNEDDTLSFVNRVITGSTPSTSMPVPGTNAAVISISPNGRFLAVGHQTGLNVVEQVTILEVASDGTISIFDTFSTPDSPLDLQWVTDEYLAVMHTDLSVTNEVIMYEFDAEALTVMEIDSEPTGSFSTALALHPSGAFLYAQNSGANRSVTAFSVNPDGTLDHIETHLTGTTYPLGIGVSANGKWLYGGGGISNGGDKILALAINEIDGSLDTIDGSPFISPGDSPKQVITTLDSLFALAGHGSDSTVQSFSIDQKTGALTATGFFYDIGFQGSLGEIAVLDDLVFAADRDTLFDDMRGVRTLRVNGDGSLTEVGTITDTEGIAPNSIAVWKPPAAELCMADFVSNRTFQPPPDGQVDGADLAYLLGEWGENPGSLADIVSSATFQPPPDGVVDAADLAVLLGAWGPCP
jgi:hypothetical protein